ncbi:alpha/beta hydrolase [Alcaligenes phenolicus]|jgi:phospholipase/carboxylesterase|uniref:Dienelactone hydrolase family protein n=1 Tax=Alcaligenes phenolicus TaxID=232846 RepID=A0AAW5VRG9_9BURK|nr:MULTISPECIES: dienelactone hydrolase family protein [Alcaligenes]MCX5566530.1 dienelactone hydrolase family protein [Alcaligenes phenolicus]QCP81629.1 carboxylesterase [Alcaligenes faecalis]QRF89444.1 carboxylesterase [Alcaligenes faecalis]SSY79397.1 Carboxylesterase 2 [Alcaligenes faecalis subsp. faecalis]HBJ70746.1 carboxylesterase [Alcaligenes faecalis]
MNPLLESIEIETGANPQHAVIWLHGLGADGHDFAPIVPELGLQNAPAIRFIFPHAPIQPVTINGGMAMRSWYDIYVADLVRHEDESGLRQSQIEVQNLIARENARGIPTENIVLAGFSQGCAMTLQTGLRLPERLAGMLCLSGYLPLAAAVEKERHQANQNTPIFMAHGSMDPVVPLTRAEASRQQLEAMGYQVQWNVYPMPHAVCPEEISAIGHFLKQVLR